MPSQHSIREEASQEQGIWKIPFLSKVGNGNFFKGGSISSLEKPG